MAERAGSCAVQRRVSRVVKLAHITLHTLSDTVSKHPTRGTHHEKAVGEQVIAPWPWRDHFFLPHYRRATSILLPTGNRFQKLNLQVRMATKTGKTGLASVMRQAASGRKPKDTTEEELRGKPEISPEDVLGLSKPCQGLFRLCSLKFHRLTESRLPLQNHGQQVWHRLCCLQAPGSGSQYGSFRGEAVTTSLTIRWPSLRTCPMSRPRRTTTTLAALSAMSLRRTF